MFPESEANAKFRSVRSSLLNRLLKHYYVSMDVFTFFGVRRSSYAECMTRFNVGRACVCVGIAEILAHMPDIYYLIRLKAEMAG